MSNFEKTTVDDPTISTETQPLYSTTYESSSGEETTTTLSSELPTNGPVLTTIEPVTPEIETSSSTGTIRPTTVETKESTNPPIITSTDSVTPEVIRTTDSVDQSSESSKPTLAPITSPLPTLAPITEEPESSTKSPDSGLNVYHWIGIGIGAILILALIFG